MSVVKLTELPSVCSEVDRSNSVAYEWSWNMDVGGRGDELSDFTAVLRSMVKEVCASLVVGKDGTSGRVE